MEKGKDYSDNDAIILQIPPIVIKDKYPSVNSTHVQNKYFINTFFKLNDKEIDSEKRNLVELSIEVSVSRGEYEVVKRVRSKSTYVKK